MQPKTETDRETAQRVYDWFGITKTAKLLKTSEYIIRELHLKTDRVKDTLKTRKRRVINPTLRATHESDFGLLAWRSLHDANKHARTLKTEQKENLTIGVLRNIKTKKVVWILINGKESAQTLRILIESARANGERIKVLRIDNNCFVQPIRDNNIKPQIIPKSTARPYNSTIESVIGQLQKRIYANLPRIRELQKTHTLREIIESLCLAEYDNSLSKFLRILEQHRERLEQNSTEQLIRTATH